MRGRTLVALVLVALAVVVAAASPVAAQSVIPIPAVPISSGTEKGSYPIGLRALINPFSDPSRPDWSHLSPEMVVWSSDSGTRPVWGAQDDVYLFVDGVGLYKHVQEVGVTLDQFQHVLKAEPVPGFGYAVHLPSGSLQPAIYALQAWYRHRNDQRVFTFLVSIKTGMEARAMGAIDLQVRREPADWASLSSGLRAQIREHWSSVQASDMEVGLPPSLQAALAAERAHHPVAPPAGPTTSVVVTPAVGGVTCLWKGMPVAGGSRLILSERDRATSPFVVAYGPETVSTTVEFRSQKGVVIKTATRTRAEVPDGRREFLFTRYPAGLYLITVTSRERVGQAVVAGLSQVFCLEVRR